MEDCRKCNGHGIVMIRNAPIMVDGKNVVGKLIQCPKCLGTGYKKSKKL